MKLLMYLDNELIETIPLNDESIPQPGYVGQFKRNLKLKYKDLIKKALSPPEFLVTDSLPPVIKEKIEKK